MNKIIQICLIILVVIFILLSIFMGVSLINHKIQLQREDKLFKTTGKIVNVNNHRLNIYIAGNKKSDITLVFMSGGGTCSPTLDFKTLYTLYEKDYQIAVVEKAGYGFSDISNITRDIDTILYETRESLKKAGIKKHKYILFPHSMSGIEALYWANKYPDEIKGIVGLDPAVPKAYENMNINTTILSLTQLSAKIGIPRLIPSIVNSSAAIKYGQLTEEEKQLYRIIFYRRTATQSMINETKAIKTNAKKLEKIDTTQVPMLFFVSNGEGTGYKKDQWRSFIKDYMNNKENVEYVYLNCSHYVHNIEYKEIYKQSLKFIRGI